MIFKQKINNIIKKNNSLLCIGLDTDLNKIPKHLLKEKDPIFTFNKAIIDSTSDLVCSYKPNIAFYEANGIGGLSSLKKTIDYLNASYPTIPIILDAKRGDIANTAKMYAKSVFEYWNADAITAFPNLGLDAIKPFLDYKDKCTIMLIKTSNPDSKVFQDILVNGEPYYSRMAKIIKEWKYDNIGIFVGATYPEELSKIRKIFPDKIFLVAGLGAQKAEIQKAVIAGIDENKEGIIFNESRSILYASHLENFAQAARIKAQETRTLINLFRNKQ